MIIKESLANLANNGDSGVSEILNSSIN